MDNAKEGVFVNRPPILDDTNNDYWKTLMVSFLKSIDSKTWKAYIKGWTPLKIRAKDGTLKQTTQKMKMKKPMEIIGLSMPFTMELRKIFSFSLILALVPKKLGIPFRPHMKAHQKFACRDYNSTLQNLKN